MKITSFITYLQNLGSDDAEGYVKEAYVCCWNNISHEEPIRHSFVTLTEIPKIVHDAPQELSWQLHKHCHLHTLESLLPPFALMASLLVKGQRSCLILSLPCKKVQRYESI